MTRRVPILLAAAAGLAAAAALAAATGAADTPLPQATNGNPVTLVAQGVASPTQFAFNGAQVFVAGGGDGHKNGGVYMIKDGKPIALPDSPPSSFGVVWNVDTLYASAGPKIVAWSAWNGNKFLKKRTVVTAPEGTPGFNGLAIGPDGRIYTGVTLAGSAYDHSHPDMPYANTFVAITPSTGKISVVATGLRQAWMPLFVKGAKGALTKGPLVSELAGNNPGNPLPRDLLVIARQGASFGFPSCFRSTEADCTTFAKPWGWFPGHTSPMGLAQVGNKIYIAMFGGVPRGNPGIVTIPRAGGAIAPFLTGFKAPVIAVGANGKTIYAGDAGGSIYKVTS